MGKGFIKNEETLKESHKVDDLLDFSQEKELFKRRINTINKPSIVALVGPFGTGKSTMLYQIQKEVRDTEKWINFDAWKYPDRQNLWEGFVLDFAKEISPEDFDRADKAVKGKQNNGKQTLIKTLSRIPGFAVLEGLNHFFETSPARRVDEVQKILEAQIKKVDKDLYIVVEDIDRSGDSGIFFLETLKQFVSTLEISKKLTIIVPISNSSYHEKIESYLKSIDYFDFFQPVNIRLEKFIAQVFEEDLFTGQFNRKGNSKLVWTGVARRTQTISFLEWLFKQDSKMSMRLLKLILRKANLVYINQVDDGHEPDFRITLCIEASKYSSVSEDNSIKYFDDFKTKGAVTRGNIFSSFLIAIFWNKNSISNSERTGRDEDKRVLLESPSDFNLVERVGGNIESHPSYPWEYSDPWKDQGRNQLALASFYFKY